MSEQHNTHTHTHTYTHTHTHTHTHTLSTTCTHRQPELERGTLLHEDEGEGSDADSDKSMEEVVVQSKPQWDCESVLSTYSNLYNHPARITEPPSLKGHREVGSAAVNLTASSLYIARRILLYVHTKWRRPILQDNKAAPVEVYDTTHLHCPPQRREGHLEV